MLRLLCRFVKCNYSPYSVIWDKAFGTFKAFEVKRRRVTEEKKRAPFESGDQNHADVRNVAVLSSASNTDAPAAAHADPLGPEKCPV